MSFVVHIVICNMSSKKERRQKERERMRGAKSKKGSKRESRGSLERATIRYFCVHFGVEYTLEKKLGAISNETVCNQVELR